MIASLYLHNQRLTTFFSTVRVDFITIPPLDNETQSLNLTFNPGQTSQCINVILLDDEDIENTEEIIFGLVVSSLRSPRRQRILIIDNDSESVLSLLLH